MTIMSSRFLSVAIVVSGISSAVFAQDVNKQDKAGFSEVRIPQITGTVPATKMPEASPQTLQPKAGQQQSAAPNKPVTCGPENAQSETCREAATSR